MVRVVCIVLAISIASCSTALHRPTSKDDEIRTLLVGSWINPPESSDYDGTPAVEVFHADGTYTVYVYDSRECARLLSEITIKWTVGDGILTSVSAQGKVMRDEIVAIGPDKMVIHSLDDDTTYLRRKGSLCEKREGAV